MPMIGKALVDIDADDLNRLCTAGMVEDEQIDFKAAIPSKDGNPWESSRQIKDHGRDQLLSTVVGFANAYGGDLIVGITEEQDSQPGRAERVTAIGACEDAAHRLAQMAQTCIDPPLAGLQIRSIPTQADGAGVVILRTGRSARGPHRLSTTKECYQRVRHETLPMTMRQIHDLTFAMARSGDAIEVRRAELAVDFATWSGINPKTRALGADPTFAYSVRAVAGSKECRLQRVHNVGAVQPTTRSYKIQRNGGKPESCNPALEQSTFRPVLRGTQAVSNHGNERSRIRQFCDGGLVYEVYRQGALDGSAPDKERGNTLYVGWLLGTILNVASTAERFRMQAGTPAVEFALDIELISTHGLVLVHGDAWNQDHGSIEQGRIQLPSYVLGPRDSWDELLTLVWTDLWHVVGHDQITNITVVAA